MSSNTDNEASFRSYVRAAEPIEARPARRTFPAPTARVRRKSSAPSALLALFLAAVCAFSLLFALELSKSELPNELAGLSAMGPDEGEESGEERLGRLKLIEAGGMIEVFAPSDRPILPLAFDAGLIQDDMTARIYAEAGTEVFSILGGTVKSVSVGSGEGGVVTVAHEGDIEVTYFGLGSVLVERGQPVLQRTVLGTLQNDVLYLRITKAGRPVDPLAFLGAAARLG